MSSLDAMRGGGFEVLRRFAKARAPVERCDLCGLEIGPDHDHLIDPAERRLVCACGACAVLFSAQAGTKFKRVPQDVTRTRRADDQRLRSGRRSGCRSIWRSSTTARRRDGWWPATPVRRARRSPCWSSRPGRKSSASIPSSPACSPTSRRCWSTACAAARTRTACFLVPIDQCFRLVGIIRMQWKGFTGGTAVWEEIDGFFAELARWRARRGQGSVPDLSFQVEGAEVTPFAMVPLLTFRLRVTNAAPDETIHNVVLRCQIQIESTRRKYQREEEAALRDLFGEPERWGQTLRAMLWTHASVVVPAVHRRDGRRAAGRLQLRLQRGGDQVFLRARWTERSRWISSSAAACSIRTAEGALQVAPISWSQEARFRLPVEHLAGADGGVLPEHAPGSSSGGTCSTGCTSTRCARASRPGSRRSSACSRRWTRKPRYEPARRSDRIASALLYEGYMLYPYRRSAVKNRQRFNFGVIYPEAHSRARQGAIPARCRPSVSCRATRPPGSTSRVRFLHLFARAPDAARASPSGTTPSSATSRWPAPRSATSSTAPRSCRFALPAGESRAAR